MRTQRLLAKVVRPVETAMAIWNVPAKLPYALFVAGNARLVEALATRKRVLEALASGPPPAVELGTWIADHGRMGAVPLSDLGTQLPAEALAELGISVEQKHRFVNATHGMLIVANEAAALDPRAPWGLLVLSAAMASSSDGIVYDSGTFRVLPHWIVESPLDGFLLGSIKNHVAVISSTDTAGMQTTTTLGLNKYGLFEVQLGGVRLPADQTGKLIAGLAQALVDARPTTPGPWEVPAAFDVSRFHVAHACATEIETGGGKTRLAVAQPDGDDIYWTVAPSADGRAASLEEAILALALGTPGGHAPETALLQATLWRKRSILDAV